LQKVFLFSLEYVARPKMNSNQHQDSDNTKDEECVETDTSGRMFVLRGVFSIIIWA